MKLRKGLKPKLPMQDQTNPFMRLTPLIPPPPEYQAPLGRGSPESRSRATRQDKPTKADADFERRHGFKAGMDKALGQARIAEKFRRSHQFHGVNMNNWGIPGDANTTRKDPRPAFGTRRDKPTAGDAMDHMRQKGIQRPAYPTPEVQLGLERARQRMIEEAEAFERGKAARASKAAKSILEHMRKKEKQQ